MSTDKTSRPYIPLLVGLLTFCAACAPQHAAFRQATAPAQSPPTALAAVAFPTEAAPPSTILTADDSTELPEETTAAEPEQTVSQEVKELAGIDNWEEGTAAPTAGQPEVSYDFPVTINRQVEFYLNFFQTSQRDTFTRWLTRSGRYLPMIKRELQAAGLPMDLAYLPMIESGYNLTAYSSAGAAGPWQFMRSTARHYGLVVNQYVDERRDPIKSTDAAIAYLKKLYEEFDSWHLAVAAYNAGEGRIRQKIRAKGTNNFWKLAQGRTLSLETKRYVPKLIAAILIAKNPAQYGFADVPTEEPLTFAVVEVPPWTSLAAVAVACNVDVETLHNLNRQLRKAVTPPTQSAYPLKIPADRSALFASNMPRVHASVSTRFKTHVVSRNDTLARICRRYNLNTTTLLKANNLRRPSLTPGQRLQIPYQTTTYTLLSEKEIAGRRGTAAVTAENLLLHTVRRGETLSQLATRYNIRPQVIASWNGLKNLNQIRAGQQLALYLDDTTRKLAAETPAAAPERLTAASSLQRGDTVAIARADNDVDHAQKRLTYYQVRGGDTLWTIAKKYNLTPAEIRRWNNLDGDIIRPGARLLLKVATTDLDV